MKKQHTANNAHSDVCETFLSAKYRKQKKNLHVHEDKNTNGTVNYLHDKASLMKTLFLPPPLLFLLLFVAAQSVSPCCLRFVARWAAVWRTGPAAVARAPLLPEPALREQHVAPNSALHLSPGENRADRRGAAASVWCAKQRAGGSHQMQPWRRQDLCTSPV